MNELTYVYWTAALIVGWVVVGVFRRSFDPFAPLWLFLAGYFQVYVIQAITTHDWAIRARTPELVAAANLRALWALAWFLLVYHCGLGRVLAARLPRPPATWSPPVIATVTPLLFAWGLVCSAIVYFSGGEIQTFQEGNLILAFPCLMLVAGILLIVTGRHLATSGPLVTWLGVGVAALYAAIWMFNGKRSHPLFGILSAICAFYVSKGRRPSKPVLVVTALACTLSVSVAINWRGARQYDRSLSGFVQYLSEFDPASMLNDLNLKDRNGEAMQSRELASRETEEYGGFLLMMDTVPAKSDYDYGQSYLRLLSTYIPRIVWHDKPLFGREQWVNAWIAGSEFVRKPDFTGPAIGVLGATQLNGGATGTLIVLAILALLLRTSYDHFRLHGHVPWIQAWWSLSFYNAWLMTVNDDPFVWFYYVYGHSMFPVLGFLWVYHKVTGRAAAPAAAAVGGVAWPTARA